MLKEDHPLVGAIIVAVCDEYRKEHFQLRLADGKAQYFVPPLTRTQVEQIQSWEAGDEWEVRR